jgi:hypothetical protein
MLKIVFNAAMQKPRDYEAHNCIIAHNDSVLLKNAEYVFRRYEESEGAFTTFFISQATQLDALRLIAKRRQKDFELVMDGKSVIISKGYYTEPHHSCYNIFDAILSELL